MKMLIQIINKTIRSNKGETIMESIASLLVLSLLLITATAMIQTALRMTGQSTQTAKEAQDVLNAITRAEYSNPAPAFITFTAPSLGLSATHEITVKADSEALAFTPPDMPASPEYP